MMRILELLSDAVTGIGFGLLLAVCLMGLFVTTNPAIKAIVDEEGAADVATRPPVTLIIICKEREGEHFRCRPETGGKDVH